MHLVRAVARRARNDEGRLLAAALTYSAFISLFPLVLLAMSVIGFLLAGNPEAVQEWVDRLTGTIPGLGPLIGRNLQAVVDGRAETGILGLLGLLWTGMGLVRSARSALARIFRRSREGILFERRGRALAALGGLGMLALASIAATATLAGVGGDGGIGLVLRVVGTAGTAAVDLAFSLVAYRVLTPGPGPSYRDLLPGAIVLVVGWTALKLAGAWYASLVVARATAVYGALAGAIGILAVLAIAARLFVYGAELSAVLVEDRRASVAP